VLPEYLKIAAADLGKLRKFPMRLNFRGERVLAVVAHPDDAELLCAGTLARAKRDGATIGICVLCRGDKGQPRRRIVNLAAARRREMSASARLLGAELFMGGRPDGSLADGLAQRLELVEIYRSFKPSLVVAHDPGDYHPDHRAASALAEAASWFSASRGHVTESPALKSPPALWWMDTVEMGGFTPGFYIDIREFIDLKTQMLACHKTQLSRGKDADFAPLQEVMHMQFRTRGLQSGVEAAEAFRAHLVFKRGQAW
jgi:LmbE family N-acetylglucosaminyl deacetylase